MPDFRDLDSDNDGLKDVIEGGHQDPDGDGIVGIGEPIVDDYGWVPNVAHNCDPLTVNAFGGSAFGVNAQAIVATSEPCDADMDGVPDYQDLDSDNDAIKDTIEAGLPDGDNDGRVGTGTPQVNTAGFVIAEDGTQMAVNEPVDTDQDGRPDYLDLDSDGDGLSDVIESGNADPDRDGFVGEGMPIVDSNGLPPNLVDMPLPDRDSNGTPDFRTPEQAPTAVGLDSFTVHLNQSSDAIVVRWTTGAEVDTFGFHVLRNDEDTDNQIQFVTEQLIGSKGPDGGSYEVTIPYDPATDLAIDQMGFWLYEEELSGTIYYYGPAAVTVDSASMDQFMFLPFLSQ